MLANPGVDGGLRGGQPPVRIEHEKRLEEERAAGNVAKDGGREQGVEHALQRGVRRGCEIVHPGGLARWIDLVGMPARHQVLEHDGVR